MSPAQACAGPVLVGHLQPTPLPESQARFKASAVGNKLPMRRPARTGRYFARCGDLRSFRPVSTMLEKRAKVKSLTFSTRIRWSLGRGPGDFCTSSVGHTLKRRQVRDRNEGHEPNGLRLYHAVAASASCGTAAESPNAWHQACLTNVLQSVLSPSASCNCAVTSVSASLTGAVC